MRTSDSSKRTGKEKKMKDVFVCSFCCYTSERFYNVSRHEIRIHTASARPRHCCDLKFVTKGDYYLHCQECHPVSRPANLTSRTKYLIDSGLKITNPPEVSQSSQRYMLRTRKIAKSMKMYREEDTEDSESSEATEFESSFEYSSSDTASLGSSSYEEKNSFVTAHENDANTTISTAQSTSVRNVHDSATIDFDKSATFYEPLNESLENNTAIDSGYCNGSTISTNTDVGDENLPIGNIDWYTNIDNVVEQTSQIGTIDWYTNFDNIENAQVTNDFVDENSQISAIDWCTNFEDVESQIEENHPFNQNPQIVTIDRCPTVENPQRENDLVNESSEMIDSLQDKNGNVKNLQNMNKNSENLREKNENIVKLQGGEKKFDDKHIERDLADKNFKIDAIEWPTKFENVGKKAEIKNDLVEANSKTIEWLPASENIKNSPEKNCNAFNIPQLSYDLPLKKRFWRYVENLQSHCRTDAVIGKSIIDRLHDRLVCKSSVQLKSRKKSRVTRKENKKTESQAAQDNKENVNSSSSSLNCQQNGTKITNENQSNSETIEIHVDPRITQDHREYFEYLLSRNPSLYDRINCMDNEQSL